MKYEIKDLDPAREPFNITLLEGIVVKVKPLQAFDLYLAKARAQNLLNELESSVDVCHEAGMLPDKGIDLSDPSQRDAIYQDFLTKELAISQIVEFVSGIVDSEDNLQTPTPENIRLLMNFLHLGPIFYQKITEKHLEFLAAKKDLGTDAAGTINQAAVPLTAMDAESKASPAQVENEG